MKKVLFISIILCSSLLFGQSTLELPEKFEFHPFSIELSGIPQGRDYFDCAGRKAILMGSETGLKEAWVYPMKLFHNFEIGLFSRKTQTYFDLKDYAVKILRNPHYTEIVYSEDKFFLKMKVFTPVNSPGGIILLDLSVFEPFNIIVSFAPDLKPMWPAGLGGQYAFWNDEIKGMILSESRRKYNGIVGCPLGKQASSSPAHQLPGGKISFEIPVEIETADKFYIPIVITGNMSGRDDAIKKYSIMLNNIEDLYIENEKYYRDLLDRTTIIDTPDKDLNTAFFWAKAAVDNGLVENEDLGTGIVAGFGLSGERERPGFAWYFGGDAFYNLFAVNSIGNFSFSRTALEFLRKYQREDGKMMHELSQGAGFVKWFEEYPYGYYHADTTPLYIIAVADYVRSSGDIGFLKETWESVKKAYAYIRSTDSDNDGLMENKLAGLGASELGSLREGLKVGVYLSAVSVESYKALSELAGLMGDGKLVKEAEKLYQTGRKSINSQFHDPETGLIPFGISIKNELKNDITVWPAVGLMFNLFEDEKAYKTLKNFSEHHLSTDWGTRMLSKKSQFYEPLAYNNGAVWPFLTGYAAMAEYNNGFVYAGFNHLKQITNNVFQHGLGSFNELFSGEHFRPLSTSVQHQLFSISPIIFNTVRGVFGVTGNSFGKTINISPDLPANWKYAKIRNFRIGDDTFDIFIDKTEDLYKIKLSCTANDVYEGTFSPGFGLLTEIEKVVVNGNQVKFDLQKDRQGVRCIFKCKIKNKSEIVIKIRQGIDVLPNYYPPEQGGKTNSLKITDFYVSGNKMFIVLEGISGTSCDFEIISGVELKQINGGKLEKLDGRQYKIKVDFENNKSRYTSKILEVEF
ncbi:amylo-alpha-1,6-glucosidase [candidate division KSB1 bacterium]